VNGTTKHPDNLRPVYMTPRDVSPAIISPPSNFIIKIYMEAETIVGGMKKCSIWRRQPAYRDEIKKPNNFYWASYLLRMKVLNLLLKQLLFLEKKMKNTKIVTTFVLHNWNVRVLQALIYIELHCNFILKTRKCSSYHVSDGCFMVKFPSMLFIPFHLHI
jgi:hypothetical protein